MENAVGSGACYRIAQALFELYVRERGKDGAPKKALLDFDATDDPTYGDQEESYYHGYFEEHIYHPLLVFDGDAGQLITTVLRSGNTHASHGTVAILKRIVALLPRAWPAWQIELRAHAGFAVPALSTSSARPRPTSPRGLRNSTSTTPSAARRKIGSRI
jgi:hypothetical protein